MFRTLVCIVSVTLAHANQAECVSAMVEMTTDCASDLPITSAGQIDTMCGSLVPPVTPSTCAVTMGKVMIKCPADPANPPAGVTISAADQSFIKAARAIAQCCMKESTAYSTLVTAAGASSSDASSTDCWSGDDSSAVPSTEFATTMTTIIAPTLISGLAVQAPAPGPAANNTTPGGAAGGGAAGGAAGGPAANNTNTTAAPKASTSNAGVTSLAMAVFTGFTLFIA